VTALSFRGLLLTAGVLIATVLGTIRPPDLRMSELRVQDEER